MLLSLLLLLPALQDRTHALHSLPPYAVCCQWEKYWQHRVNYLEGIAWRHQHDDSQRRAQLAYAKNAVWTWEQARIIQDKDVLSRWRMKYLDELLEKQGNPPRLPRP